VICKPAMNLMFAGVPFLQVCKNEQIIFYRIWLLHSFLGSDV
jgi:hypothetical protein